MCSSLVSYLFIYLFIFRSESSSESSSNAEQGSVRGSPSRSSTPKSGDSGRSTPQSSGDEGDIEVGEEVSKGKDVSQTMEELFGGGADLSSSDEEGPVHVAPRIHEEVDFGEDREVGVAEELEERAEEEEEEEETPRINVDIPRCVAHLGSDLHFVKLPNFLSVETR